MISTPEKNLQPTNKTEKKLFRSATIQERMIKPIEQKRDSSEEVDKCERMIKPSNKKKNRHF